MNPTHKEAIERNRMRHKELRGKNFGVCRVCRGTIRAITRTRQTGMVGGPPGGVVIVGHRCERCRLMYWEPMEQPEEV